jgi:hypothetical protein
MKKKYQLYKDPKDGSTDTEEVKDAAQNEGSGEQSGEGSDESSAEGAE